MDASRDDHDTPAAYLSSSMASGVVAERETIRPPA